MINSLTVEELLEALTAVQRNIPELFEHKMNFKNRGDDDGKQWTFILLTETVLSVNVT